MAPPNKVDNARAAAVAALVRIHLGEKAHTAARALAARPLNERDGAFAGALFFGSVERLVTLDYLLAPFLKRPVEKLDAEVRAILECGLYQPLYMRVPQSAAVNEAVKLARGFGKSSAAGMANAVLRKALAAVPMGTAGPDLARLPFKNEAERVQVQWAVGPAVATAVMEALPQDYDAFFAHSFSTGEVCLRANTLKTNAPHLREQLVQAGAQVRGGFLPQALYAALPGPVARQPVFQQGLCHVQGEASQYACACLAVQSGQKVLDVCAAPGGKSATLAQQLGGGAGLCCADISAARLPMLRENFERLGIAGATVLQNDATVYNPALCGQQRVLCDVPCSGLGVLAQKPDLRQTDGAHFEALPALQLKVLSTSARYVEKGGRLVYSTCTVRGQENAGVVRAFLGEHAHFKLVAPPAPPAGALLEQQMVTLLPHRTGTDGFFVAVMENV